MPGVCLSCYKIVNEYNLETLMQNIPCICKKCSQFTIGEVLVMGRKSRIKKEEKKVKEIRERKELIEIKSEKKGVKRYLYGDCDVLIGIERIDQDNPVWHMNIFCNGRSPTYKEIVSLRYMLIPREVTVAIFLPPGGEKKDVRQVDLWEVKFTME